MSFSAESNVNLCSGKKIKRGHSKLEIESLVPEYIQHWLYTIL